VAARPRQACCIGRTKDARDAPDVAVDASGGVLDEADWRLVAELCVRDDLLLIIDAPWNGCCLMIDGSFIRGLSGWRSARHRGLLGKELRMIGWRVAGSSRLST